MRLFGQYLRLHRKSAVLFLAFVLIYAVVFSLYRLPLEAVLYAGGLCLLAFALLAGLDFWRFRARHMQLADLRKRVFLGVDGMPDLPISLKRITRRRCAPFGTTAPAWFRARMRL